MPQERPRGGRCQHPAGDHNGRLVEPLLVVAATGDLDDQLLRRRRALPPPPPSSPPQERRALSYRRPQPLERRPEHLTVEGPSEAGPEEAAALAVLGIEGKNLLGQEDFEDIGAALDPNSTAGLMIWENIWAARFAKSSSS